MPHDGLLNLAPEGERRQPFASGGLGSVFLVNKPLLGGLCVEKRLHPHLAELRCFRQRFVLEARIGLALRHPNLSQTLLLVDAPGAGLRFYQPLVPGPTLTRLRPLLPQLAPGVRLALAGQLLADGFAALDGLYEVRIAGRPGGRVLAHSDIAPANFVMRDDATFVLIDYGQAHTSDRPDGEMDTSGHASRFMAPWCLHAKERTSCASDAWSLALVALDIATGCSFHAEGAERFDVTGLLERVLRASRDLRTYEKSFPWLPAAQRLVHCETAKEAAALAPPLRAQLPHKRNVSGQSDAVRSSLSNDALHTLRSVVGAAFEDLFRRVADAAFGATA